MERGHWTDERIGEKMNAIDSTFDMQRGELRALREETRQEFVAMREDNREQFGALRTDFAGLRTDFAGLRTDFAALQRQLTQIGFGLVGVLAAAMVALIVA